MLLKRSQIFDGSHDLVTWCHDNHLELDSNPKKVFDRDFLNMDFAAVADFSTHIDTHTLGEEKF